MKKFLLALLMTISSVTGAQQTKTEVFFSDDSWVHVPLQFSFPFYGKLFTNSFMFSNGVVAFYGVNVQPQTSFCCSGVEVNNQTWAGFNYTIMPMQTDLYPVATSKFYTQGDGTFQKYWWENIAEISNTNNLNTFSVEIKPSGYIGIKYDQINIQNQYVTSAIIGDASKGEYTVHYSGLGMNASSVPSLIEYQSTGNVCTSNPLASTSCPGYTQAYHDYQCSLNPLYASTCTGYTQAYFNQQCSINPLYNNSCPGYAQAYFDQQCSLNPLYSTNCPGYAQAYFDQQCSADPLYNNQCPGYSSAYKTQQCNLNALYATDCPGYAQAYFNQQCNANPLYNVECPGYGQAYFNQQCSLNPLYNANCTGYTQAYHNQQCLINSLYATDCPGYAQAYFNQQCQLNGLYDAKCPNYATEYAKKTLFEKNAAVVDIAGTTSKNDTTNLTGPITTTTIMSTVTTQPETTSVTSTTSVSPAAIVSVIKTPAPVSTTQQVQQIQPQIVLPTQQQTQKQQEERKTENQVANKIEKSVGDSSKDDKNKMKDAVAKVQKEIAKESKEAKTIEAQVATQGLVVGSMNFVPGFDAYKNSIIPDTNALLMARQYQKPVVDNQRAQRRLSGANESKWQEMVDSQYQLGK